MVNLQAQVDPRLKDGRSHCGVRDVLRAINCFDSAVDDSVAVIEEWGEFPEAEVTVLVDRASDDSATVFSIPPGKVRPTPEK